MDNKEPKTSAIEADKLLGSRTFELLHISESDRLTVVNQWQRGGAETYVTDFIVERECGGKEHLIAKACIKFSPREAMAEWLERRQTMQNNGVQFPELFAVDGATIIEEFIPFTFKEAFKQSDDNQRIKLREKYIDTYKRIYGAGFIPVSLHDVRSHGDDVVVIDVGEDIGGYMPIDLCDLSVILKAESSFRDMIS